MKIHESEGVRTFRRDLRSVRIAQAIKTVMGAQMEVYLSDVAQCHNWGVDLGVKDAAAYQAVQRAMPFEVGGLVYSVVSETQTRAYQKTKKVVVKPGKLEDYEPRREKAKTTIDKRIDACLAELAQWTNVFALREEAKKYMDAMRVEFYDALLKFDARLKVIETRLKKIEDSMGSYGISY